MAFQLPVPARGQLLQFKQDVRSVAYMPRHLCAMEQGVKEEETQTFIFSLQMIGSDKNSPRESALKE